MKIKDILDMSNEEFNKLSYQELQPIVRTMVRVANSRMTRLKNLGIFSPATEDKSKFKMPTGQNLNMLRAEYRKASDFLNSKTSTVSGARHFEKLVTEHLNTMRKGGLTQLNYAEMDDEQRSKLWQLYNAIYEISPHKFNNMDSGQRLELASKYYRRNVDYNELKERLRQELQAEIESDDNKVGEKDLSKKDGLFHDDDLNTAETIFHNR